MEISSVTERKSIAFDLLLLKELEHLVSLLQLAHAMKTNQELPELMFPEAALNKWQTLIWLIYILVSLSWRITQSVVCSIFPYLWNWALFSYTDHLLDRVFFWDFPLLPITLPPPPSVLPGFTSKINCLYSDLCPSLPVSGSVKSYITHLSVVDFAPVYKKGSYLVTLEFSAFVFSKIYKATLINFSN